MSRREGVRNSAGLECLPMLLAAPKDVVALNDFFDTLLFAGAILVLAGASFRAFSPPSGEKVPRSGG
jgi:hypothetical protein